MFELMRGDHLRAAKERFRACPPSRREHDLKPMAAPFWSVSAGFGRPLAERARPADGLEDMRRGAELLRETERSVVRWVY